MTFSPEMYAELQAAIVKAVPEIADLVADGVDWKTVPYLLRPISLEDVLRAVQAAWMTNELNYMAFPSKYKENIFWVDILENVFDRWSLGKPLSEQSDETKMFLHSLLCNQ